jgi:phage-related protein
MPWTIQFYILPGGKCPTIEFIETLPKADQRVVLDRFDRIQRVGPTYNMSWVKPFGDGLFELRFHIRDGIIRFFFFYQPNQIIVLTHGFQKKTNKTPNHEIDIARAYMHEWIKEHKQ